MIAMAGLAVEELTRIETGEVVTPGEYEEALAALNGGNGMKPDPKPWANLLKKLATSKDFAFKCCAEVAEYLQPKRKAIEHTGQVDTAPVLNVILASDE